jgi:hypothetical protein
VITCHSREIEIFIIVVIIMLLPHGIYLNDNWRPGETGLDGFGPGWAIERGFGYICSACVD